MSHLRQKLAHPPFFWHHTITLSDHRQRADNGGASLKNAGDMLRVLNWLNQMWKLSLIALPLCAISNLFYARHSMDGSRKCVEGEYIQLCCSFNYISLCNVVCEKRPFVIRGEVKAHSHHLITLLTRFNPRGDFTICTTTRKGERSQMGKKRTFSSDRRREKFFFRLFLAIYLLALNLNSSTTDSVREMGEKSFSTHYKRNSSSSSSDSS